MSQLNPAAERSLCHFSSKKVTLAFVLSCNFFLQYTLYFDLLNDTVWISIDMDTRARGLLIMGEIQRPL